MNCGDQRVKPPPRLLASSSPSDLISDLSLPGSWASVMGWNAGAAAVVAAVVAAAVAAAVVAAAVAAIVAAAAVTID